MDPAATAEPLIAEDVKADICTGKRRRRRDQGGTWEAKRGGRNGECFLPHLLV